MAGEVRRKKYPQPLTIVRRKGMRRFVADFFKWVGGGKKEDGFFFSCPQRKRKNFRKGKRREALATGGKGRKEKKNFSK